MVEPSTGKVTVSIVSHGHGAEVSELISRLVELRNVALIVLTWNLGFEECSIPEHPKILVVISSSPLGFGANHNRASQYCKTEFFCVLNPDVKFLSDPFPNLLGAFEVDKVGLVAPRVKSSNGEIQDSARLFPNVLSLAGKLIGRDSSNVYLNPHKELQEVDWAAGMFMLFDLTSFLSVGGFDERFFMYYEDVDICARLRLRGVTILLVASEWILHDARRESRRSIKLFVFHASSMMKFFVKYRLGFICPTVVRK